MVDKWWINVNSIDLNSDENLYDSFTAIHRSGLNLTLLMLRGSEKNDMGTH